MASVEYLTRPEPGRRFRAALFDFDGTVSLIRQGWQDVMIPYFTEVLSDTPEGRQSREEDLYACAREFVDRLTGKQTIFQCMALDEAVVARGGPARDPMAYKNEYLRRLMQRIDSRLSALRSGSADPEDYLVRGASDFLRGLCEMEMPIFLASGTDQPAVREEARLLGVDRFFGDRIFGARDEDATACSKELVIRRILTEQGLSGRDLLSFGDGFVEIELVANIGGYPVAVATDEARRQGVDPAKRERLIAAGAAAVVPDFGPTEELLSLVRNGGKERAL